MLKTKTVRIDDKLYTPPPGATVADVVPWDVQSITTPSGALITREQFARVPVPEGFDTNLSVINKGDGVDRIESPSVNGSVLMRRLRASHTAFTSFFATSPIWRWTVVSGKLVGLSIATAGGVAAGYGAGRLLILDDAALRSAFALDPDGSGFDAMRGTLLTAVVIATAVTVAATGRMRSLWQLTLAVVPGVQHILVLMKFTLRLCGTIVLAVFGGVMVAVFLPAALRDGELEELASLAAGLLFLGFAARSIVQWARSGEQNS